MKAFALSVLCFAVTACGGPAAPTSPSAKNAPTAIGAIRSITATGRSGAAATETPYGLTYSVQANTVALSWTAVVPEARIDPNVTVEGYFVEAGAAPGGTELLDKELPASSTSFSITVGNGTYYVRVHAVFVCKPNTSCSVPDGRFVFEDRQDQPPSGEEEWNVSE